MLKGIHLILAPLVYTLLTNTQTSFKMPVPVSAKSKIIGSGGKNLKALTTKTMVKIDIARESRLDEDDEEVSDVTISGDADGIEMARKEIQAVVDELVLDKQARANTPRPLDLNSLFKHPRDTDLFSYNKFLDCNKTWVSPFTFLVLKAQAMLTTFCWWVKRIAFAMPLLNWENSIKPGPTCKQS